MLTAYLFLADISNWKNWSLIKIHHAVAPHSVNSCPLVKEKFCFLLLSFAFLVPFYLEHCSQSLFFFTRGQFVPVFAKWGFSHAPCSNYRSILSSCSYYLEDFDYRSILVDSGTIVHWEIYFSAVIAFQPQVPNGETLFQRQRRILPNRSAPTLGWTWQPISIFGNFYKLPNMWLQPGRFIALWKICIKTSIFVFLSLANYEQNQYKVSTLEREWAA